MRKPLAPTRGLAEFPVAPLAGSDAQAAAMREVAQAINRHADSCLAAAEALRPAAETIHGMGARLDALCDWLKRKGPWFLASAPLVLVAIQAISPEAGKALASILEGASR